LKLLKSFILIVACLLLSVESAMASAMSVAAAGLSPGQFAVLKPSNAPRVNYPNTYADSATWDPINKKIYFVGQGDDTLGRLQFSYLRRRQ